MIFQFARFDLASWLPRKQSILPLIFIAVVGIALPVPGMAIVAAAFVASLMISAPFLGDERGRLDTLYGVLPISRGTVVAGRTLSIVTYYLISAVIATVVTIAVTLVRGSEIPVEILLVAHLASFAFVGLSMSLQLPVLFKMGFSRGRLMAYAPALVIAAVLWLTQAVGFVDEISSAAEDIPLALAAGVALVLGVAGIVLGTVFATKAFAARELR